MRAYSKILVAVTLALASAAAIYAQRMTNWEWKAHNLKFQMPSHFKVTANNANILSANDGSSFTMSLTPWKDDSVDARGVAHSAFNRYSATGKTIAHEEKAEAGKYDAYIVVGTGNVSGKPLWIVIVGFIDKESDFNLAAQFFWWDNPSRNDEFVALAQKIIASIDR